jgi:hypothetical protein
MTDILEYLKSSELVFEVQKFFGVRPSEEGNSKKPFKATNKFFYYLFLLGTELGERTLIFSSILHKYKDYF